MEQTAEDGTLSGGLEHNRKVEINGAQEHLSLWIRRQTAKCKSSLFLKAKSKEFSGEVNLEITWAKAKLLPTGKTHSLAADDATYVRV